jgi:hypothetical protein
MGLPAKQVARTFNKLQNKYDDYLLRAYKTLKEQKMAAAAAAAGAAGGASSGHPHPSPPDSGGAAAARAAVAPPPVPRLRTSGQGVSSRGVSAALATISEG